MEQSARDMDENDLEGDGLSGVIGDVDLAQNSVSVDSSEVDVRFLLPIRFFFSISNRCPAPRLESSTALDPGFETTKNSANSGAPLSGSMIGGLTQPRKIEHSRS